MNQAVSHAAPLCKLHVAAAHCATYKAYPNSIEILFSGLEVVHDPCVQLLTLIQRLSTLTPPDDDDERPTAKLATPPPLLTANSNPTFPPNLTAKW